MSPEERCPICGLRLLGPMVSCAFCGADLRHTDRAEELGPDELAEHRWSQVWGMGRRAWLVVLGLSYGLLALVILWLLLRS